MPNVKIFVDDAVYTARGRALREMLPSLRAAICEQLSVPAEACQLAVVPVIGMEGQPSANMEIQYLAKPGRTPEMITAACTALRDVVEAAAGSRPAVRATPLDPATYVALKL